MSAAVAKREHAASPRYAPPENVRTVRINDAIAEGGRTTKTYRAKASGDLFGSDRDPAAAKVWYAGDLSLLKRTCVAIVGTRNPQVIFENLTNVGELPPGEIVLIDDVYSTGAHMRAAAWEIHDYDAARAPVLGLSCGRTLHAQLPDPLTVAPEDLALQIRTGGTFVKG